MAVHGVKCSLPKSGNVRDYAAMVCVFSLRTERSAGKVCRSRAATRLDVLGDIERLNGPRRRHATLGGLGPMDFEQQTRLA